MKEQEQEQFVGRPYFQLNFNGVRANIFRSDNDLSDFIPVLCYLGLKQRHLIHFPTDYVHFSKQKR